MLYEECEPIFSAGVEETKLTSASPSKNHLHKLQLEEMNPDLVPLLHQGNLMSRNHNDGGTPANIHELDHNRMLLESRASQQQMEVTMIGRVIGEKQLNSYI